MSLFAGNALHGPFTVGAVESGPGRALSASLGSLWQVNFDALWLPHPIQAQCWKRMPRRRANWKQVCANIRLFKIAGSHLGPSRGATRCSPSPPSRCGRKEGGRYERFVALRAADALHHRGGGAVGCNQWERSDAVIDRPTTPHQQHDRTSSTIRRVELVSPKRVYSSAQGLMTSTPNLG